MATSREISIVLGVLMTNTSCSIGSEFGAERFQASAGSGFGQCQTTASRARPWNEITVGAPEGPVEDGRNKIEPGHQNKNEARNVQFPLARPGSKICRSSM